MVPCSSTRHGPGGRCAQGGGASQGRHDHVGRGDRLRALRDVLVVQRGVEGGRHVGDVRGPAPEQSSPAAHPRPGLGHAPERVLDPRPLWQAKTFTSSPELSRPHASAIAQATRSWRVTMDESRGGAEFRHLRDGVQVELSIRSRFMTSATMSLPSWPAPLECDPSFPELPFRRSLTPTRARTTPRPAASHPDAADERGAIRNLQTGGYRHRYATEAFDIRHARSNWSDGESRRILEPAARRHEEDFFAPFPCRNLRAPAPAPPVQEIRARSTYDPGGRRRRVRVLASGLGGSHHPGWAPF